MYTFKWTCLLKDYLLCVFVMFVLQINRDLFKKMRDKINTSFLTKVK